MTTVRKTTMRHLGLQLVSLAQSRKTTTYTDIGSPLGITNLRLLDKPLGNLSKLAIEHGFPPISALVVNKDVGIPGPGFFTLVQNELGIDAQASDWAVLHQRFLEQIWARDDWDRYAALVESTYSDKRATPAPKRRSGGGERVDSAGLLARTVERDLYAEAVEHGEVEGKVVEYYGRLYERSATNRRRAISLHGLTCFVCGFNFEAVYGPRGKNFIEMHHVNPISRLGSEGQPVNPETDLVPVCANCHRMIHRDPNDVLSWQALKEIVEKRRAQTSARAYEHSSPR